MSRYLVTGATGFIGHALCARLTAEGHHVRALARRAVDGPWTEVYCSDLAVDTLPEGLTAGIDGIFHLAGIAHAQDQSAVPDSLYRRVNLEATQALLNAAVAARVARFVYFSSIKAAADPGEECVDETWDQPPEDAYGRTKREAEERVVACGVSSAMHVCILRPTLVYGSGVKGNLQRVLEAARVGRCPPLPEFGNRRSMIGRDDLLDAALLAAEDPRANGRTYIVADGVAYSTRMLFEIACRAFGHDQPRWGIPLWLLRLGALAGDVLGRMSRRPMPLSSAVLSRIGGSACYRADRLRSELGWRPQQRLEGVVDAMVKAYGPHNHE